MMPSEKGDGRGLIGPETGVEEQKNVGNEGMGGVF